MKVFNLTDVETLLLVQHGFVRQTFIVRDKLIAPGEHAEVQNDYLAERALEHLLPIGAAAVDELPPAYVLAKSRALPPTPTGEPSAEPEAPPATTSKSKKAGPA
jgi:hypothetical protein